VPHEPAGSLDAEASNLTAKGAVPDNGLAERIAMGGLFETTGIACPRVCSSSALRLDCLHEYGASSGEEEGIAANASELRANLTRIPVELNSGCCGWGREIDRIRDVEFKRDYSIGGLNRG
jgi:hypothetical protein